MTMVEPDSDLNYMILKVIPDSTVEYQIRLIDPISGKENEELSEQIGPALNERLQR